MTPDERCFVVDSIRTVEDSFVGMGATDDEALRMKLIVARSRLDDIIRYIEEA